MLGKRAIRVAVNVSRTGFLYGLDTGKWKVVGPKIDTHNNCKRPSISIGRVTEMDQFRDSIGRLSSARQRIYVACVPFSAAISSLLSGHVSDQIISQVRNIMWAYSDCDWDGYIN